MAGRRVVVKDGAVQSVQSNGVSVYRKGLEFKLRVKTGTAVRVSKSMHLDRLLAQLENRQLATNILSAFSLEKPTPRELADIFPKFSLHFTKVLNQER